MNKIKVKQIEDGELTDFVNNIMTGQTLGTFYSNSVELTSGVEYQVIDYGVTYSNIPKIAFSLRRPSGVAYNNIIGYPLEKGLSSVNFEFSNAIPSTGYSIDIITCETSSVGFSGNVTLNIYDTGNHIPLLGNTTVTGSVVNGYLYNPTKNLITGIAALGSQTDNSLSFSWDYSINGFTFQSYSWATGIDVKTRNLYDEYIARGASNTRPGGISWGKDAKHLRDAGGSRSVDWESRQLFPHTGNEYRGADSQHWSLDYQYNILQGTPTLPWSYIGGFIGPISGMSAQEMTSPYINGGLSDTVVIVLTGNNNGTPAYNKSSILLYDGQKLEIITYSTGNNFMQWPTGSATSKIGVVWPDGVIHSGTSGNANTGYYNIYTIRSITGLYGINGTNSASQAGWKRFFIKHHGTYT